MTLSPKKRPSNDDNEFMPVTKRLNLLSIDNSRESTSDSSTYTGGDENEINGNELSQHLNQLQGQQHSPSLAEQMYMNQLYNQSYNPVLSSAQNPIYYEANRILFEAHQLRTIRMQKVRS